MEMWLINRLNILLYGEDYKLITTLISDLTAIFAGTRNRTGKDSARMRCAGHRLFPMTLLVVSMLMLSLFSPARIFASENNREVLFDTLREQLVKDGFEVDLVKRIYSSPVVRFDHKGIAQFFRHSESRLNYDQFTTYRSIGKARNYMKEHLVALKAAEKAYGVDKEVITAIILVETRLGSYLGNRFIINTLSTMASLSDAAVRKQFWEKIPTSGRLSREDFEKKANRKSGWAYKELKALLIFSGNEDIDPVAIKGSYAGAMGIAQFMPSNVVNLARDGNMDGSVDLFTHADAIASIGNYLKHFGWKSGIDRKKRYQVILKYNYSKYYANTILTIRERLKG
jgi:membrane-bound lytic murein transglycosylase B